MGSLKRPPNWPDHVVLHAIERALACSSLTLGHWLASAGAPSTHDSEEPIMQAVTIIGLDIAKSVFQVHGIDAEDSVLIREPSTHGS